jgi:hypothetical protein
MTLTELNIAVLQDLGVLATGESANAADATIVGNRYSELYEMLLTEGLVSWTSTESVPDFAAKPLTWMVAYLCCNAFGVTPERKRELELLGALSLAPNKGGPSQAERQLRRQLARAHVSHPLKTTYY